MNFRFIQFGYTMCLAVCVFSASFAPSVAMADAHGDKAISPVLFSAQKMAGKDLSEADHQRAKKRGNPRQIISQAKQNPGSDVFFAGDIIALVYESTPAKFRLENTLYDEFIQVLEGTLFLTTEATGKTDKYVVGDYLVLPKGWTGIWEMQGPKYRELVISEATTLMDDSSAD